MVALVRFGARSWKCEIRGSGGVWVSVGVAAPDTLKIIGGKVLSQRTQLRVWDFSPETLTPSEQSPRDSPTQTNPCISFSLHLIFPSSLVYCSSPILLLVLMQLWIRLLTHSMCVSERLVLLRKALLSCYSGSFVLREHENSQPGFITSFFLKE